MAKSYKKIYTAEPVLNQLQDNIDQTLKPLINSEIGDGQLIENIFLPASTETLVEHKLGRELRGYIVVKRNAGSNIFDKQDVNIASDRFLILDTNVAVTVSLWVF